MSSYASNRPSFHSQVWCDAWDKGSDGDKGDKGSGEGGDVDVDADADEANGDGDEESKGDISMSGAREGGREECTFAPTSVDSLLQ